MTGKPLPLTPDVLRWALEEDGRALADVAAAAGKFTEEDLRGWLDGDGGPTAGQLTGLAAALGRPRALFFMPQPPQAAGLPAAFRHPPGTDAGVSPEPSVLRTMRRARRVQHATSWALRDGPPLNMPALTLDVGRVDAAAVALEWLGAEPRYADEWAAWRGRRALLEERELLVFSLALGDQAVRGFSAWDDRAPLIVVNSTANTPQVRSFTLFHELGHLLVRSDAACAAPAGGGVPDADVERWCEAFAAEALMPRGEVVRAAAGARQALDAVKAVARRFWVSHRAAALRLIELRLADEDLYRQVEAVFQPRGTGAGGSGEHRHETRLREFGERPLRLVLGSLQPRDALSVLRLQVDDVRSLAATLPHLDAAL